MPDAGVVDLAAGVHAEPCQPDLFVRGRVAGLEHDGHVRPKATLEEEADALAETDVREVHRRPIDDRHAATDEADDEITGEVDPGLRQCLDRADGRGSKALGVLGTHAGDARAVALGRKRKVGTR